MSLAASSTVTAQTNRAPSQKYNLLTNLNDRPLPNAL